MFYTCRRIPVAHILVSGKQILQLWYFNKKKFDVENMFPDSRGINFTNKLFEKYIVENEEDCLTDASALLKEIDNILSIIDLNADLIDLNTKRTCKVCGRGKYELIVNDDSIKTQNFGFSPAGRKMKIFTCSYCGNVQLFSYKKELPPAWKNKP